MSELPEAFEPFHVHGSATDVWTRAEVNFAELAEKELGPEAKAPQFVPLMPIPQDLPVPPDPPSPSAPAPLAVIEEAERAAGPGGLAAAPILDDSFPAVEHNFFLPPDVAGAVGPDHLLVAHNGTVRIQDKTGVTISTTSLNAFWGLVSGGGSAFDPKVLFDPAWGRWIITSCMDARLATSALLLGVSEGADPTGNWRIVRLTINAADGAWADYPSIGLNEPWVVVQVNMFVGSTFDRSHVYVFQKRSLLSGLPPAYWPWYSLFSLSGVGGTQVPVVNESAARPQSMVLLQRWNGTTGHLRLYSIAPVTVTTGSGYSETGPGNCIPEPLVATSQTWASQAPSPNFGPQLSGAQSVDLGDDRIRNNVILRAGVTHDHIFAVHTVFVPATPTPLRSAVQFWVLRTDRTVEQVARLDDGAGGNGAPSSSTEFYAYPSLAVTALQSVLIGFARFAANRRPGAGWAYRWGTDPPGTLQTGGVIKSGEGAYVNLDPNGRNQWGDYSSTCADPDTSEGPTMWSLQEFARPPAGTGTGSGRWGTWWAKVRFPEIG
jgi:hypothetical protein